MDDEEIADRVYNRLVNSDLLKKPTPKAPKVNWERKLVYEYVAFKYGDWPAWFRHEVGPYKNSDRSKLYARTRRWADAIVRLDTHMLIIEGKMKADPGSISQLEEYVRLFPETPEFKIYKDRPVKGVVLSSIDVPDVRAQAARWNLEFDIYQPSNFEDWYVKYQLKGQKEK